MPSVLHQNGGIVQMSFLRQTLLYQTCAVSMEMNGQIIVPLSAQVSYTVNEQVHQSRHAHTHTHTPGPCGSYSAYHCSECSPKPLHVFVLLLDCLFTWRGSQLDSEERGHSSRDIYPRAIFLLGARWQRSLL